MNQDPEIAELIGKFSRLDELRKARLLGMVTGLLASMGIENRNKPGAYTDYLLDREPVARRQSGTTISVDFTAKRRSES